ncbi:class I SAM-dependent methyltransferase [Pedococcus dokdonensis]|uniref:class I SAM-dependent methyltransferase n=1 Tax=Pedococcus dokdonensis TaxID=443156 RepID=UPI0012FDD9E1|nr:methyltransferase domain-containing protein [Pedococcus dokdonensis]
MSQLMEGYRTLRAAPVRVSSRVLRPRLTKQLAEHTKVHLGCGPYTFDGWANLDLGGGSDVVSFDLTARLPFEDASLDRIFTEHFIEHVTRQRGARFLRECARVLKPGGVLRVSTPDLVRLVDEYLAGRTTEWTDQGWTPATPAQMLNEGMRQWGHRFVYDEPELIAAIRSAGFADVTRVAWRESQHEDLRGLEQRSFHGDLIVEATR